jgi:L-threonylcarbamoyladenylate synthase
LGKNLISLDPDSPDEVELSKAARLVRAGKVIVYPTDTTYALGVNALDSSAIAKVYELKDRDLDKPLHVVVSDLEMARKLAVFNLTAIAIAQRFFPGPLTIVLPRRENVPEILVGGRPTIGIRIPANRICLGIVQRAQVPITTTSANVSGGENPYVIDQAIKQFSQLEDSIDLFINQGPIRKYRKPSTIVEVTSLGPTLIREGPISLQEILEFLA